MMGFGVIFTFLGLGALAYMLGWRPQNSEGLGQLTGGRNETPLEILKTRYARGEVSKAEYETMHADLLS